MTFFRFYRANYMKNAKFATLKKNQANDEEENDYSSNKNIKAH